MKTPNEYHVVLKSATWVTLFLVFALGVIAGMTAAILMMGMAR